MKLKAVASREGNLCKNALVRYVPEAGCLRCELKFFDIDSEITHFCLYNINATIVTDFITEIHQFKLNSRSKKQYKYIQYII